MSISNSASKMKLSYDDVCDMILTEEACKKYSSEFFGIGITLF